MNQKLLVKNYESALEDKKYWTKESKGIEQGIASEKKTIDRLLKSIKIKTEQLSRAITMGKTCDQYIEVNKMRYMDCKVNVTELAKLLKQQEKIQDKINKMHAIKRLFGA